MEREPVLYLRAQRGLVAVFDLRWKESQQMAAKSFHGQVSAATVAPRILKDTWTRYLLNASREILRDR